MTKKLEELFDLPANVTDSELSETSSVFALKETIKEIDNTIDKIDNALPAVTGLDSSDSELDELSDLAKQSFQDLSDLGMQVDSRYASEIFSVAGQMLGHAIAAKNAKLTKKLKMIELQLKKAKLDQDSAGQAAETIPTAQGVLLDRNELLNRLLNKTNNAPDTQ